MFPEHISLVIYVSLQGYVFPRSIVCRENVLRALALALALVLALLYVLETYITRDIWSGAHISRGNTYHYNTSSTTAEDPCMQRSYINYIAWT